jgi:hypothetical protein
MIVMAEYSPNNVQAYYGKRFVTENSVYGISEDGKWVTHSTPDGIPLTIEKSRIDLIAAVPDGLKTYDMISRRLNARANPQSRDDLVKILNRDGKKPEVGLRLVVCLSEEDAKRTGRNGVITSKIKEIN